MDTRRAMASGTEILTKDIFAVLTRELRKEGWLAYDGGQLEHPESHVSIVVDSDPSLIVIQFGAEGDSGRRARVLVTGDDAQELVEITIFTATTLHDRILRG